MTRVTPGRGRRESASFKPVDEQTALLSRGSSEIIQEEGLREKLKSSLETGRPLTVKTGFDPTSPDLHLGHTVLLEKMRQFQELGHRVVFLIGDFTGMIGDPSGLSETRKVLTREQVTENARTYERQVFKVLDRSKTTVEFNSRWMASMTAEALVHLSAHYNVARMLERDDFQKRYREQRSISIHEFLYPLIQGYDSVVLKADVELGGTDQKFNLLMGRELQKAYGQDPQVVITVPILEGTDGIRKMSKSLGNAIALEDPPREMFGKLMSISDAMMLRYYELLTAEDLGKVRDLHPMEAKKNLAERLVAQYWGEREARSARDQFAAVFSQKAFPESIPVTLFKRSSFPSSWTMIDVLTAAGLVKSRSEARRLVAQGAIQVNGERISALEHLPPMNEDLEIKVGKKKFGKVRIQDEG